MYLHRTPFSDYAVAINVDYTSIISIHTAKYSESFVFYSKFTNFHSINHTNQYNSIQHNIITFILSKYTNVSLKYSELIIKKNTDK